jgi:hypothetical protein
VHRGRKKQQEFYRAQQKSKQSSPTLHLQHTVARHCVYDGKPNDEQPSRVAKASKMTLNEVALAGYGNQFGRRTVEEQNEESEYQPHGCPQNLVQADQDKTNWTHAAFLVE